MVASQVACEAIWMRKIIVGIFSQEMDLTVNYCDNHNCIKLSKNPVFHDRSEQIYSLSLYQRLCSTWVIQLQYVPTGEQVTNILTKSLRRAKFTQFREQLGMIENPFQFRSRMQCRCSVR